MSNLQQKLKENQGKIKREKFLSTLDQELSHFLSAAEFSSDTSCIKNAAFPAWNQDTSSLTTSRGDLKNWNNFKFKTWRDLISLLKKFNKVKNYIGWFFVDADGPYYRISLNSFFAHLDGLADYADKHGQYNFGWVGSPDDVGIIISRNSSSENTGDKKFEISIWGM